jgi:hypothetical protein
MILRDRDPAEHFARMLGPRVGLRMRRPIMAAMRAPFAYTLRFWVDGDPVRITFAAGEEARWSVEPLRAALVADKVRQWAQTDHAAFVERTAGASADPPP